jgi:hypothetical protein
MKWFSLWDVSPSPLPSQEKGRTFSIQTEKSVQLNIRTSRSQIRCPFSAKEVLEGDDIHKEITAYLGINVVGHSTVAKYLGSASFAPETPDTPVPDEFKVIDAAILKALERALFCSVCELAEFKYHALSTVH